MVVAILILATLSVKFACSYIEELQLYYLRDSQ